MACSFLSFSTSMITTSISTFFLCPTPPLLLLPPPSRLLQFQLPLPLPPHQQPSRFPQLSPPPPGRSPLLPPTPTLFPSTMTILHLAPHLSLNATERLTAFFSHPWHLPLGPTPVPTLSPLTTTIPHLTPPLLSRVAKMPIAFSSHPCRPLLQLTTPTPTSVLQTCSPTWH